MLISAAHILKKKLEQKIWSWIHGIDVRDPVHDDEDEAISMEIPEGLDIISKQRFALESNFLKTCEHPYW